MRRLKPMKNRGNRATAAVDFREALRTEARKMSRKVDQVVVGTVRAVRGETVSVLIDGFRAGNITVGWASPIPAAVGQRVTMVGLAGGQEWYVTGVLADSTIAQQKETIAQMQRSIASLSTRVAALENP